MILDQVMALVNSLNANRLDDSTERGLGSPFPAHGLKQFTAASRFSSSLDGNNKELMASPTAKPSEIDTQASSPISQRLLHTNESPTWRRGEAAFVREMPSHEEDPFVSSSSESQSCSVSK